MPPPAATPKRKRSVLTSLAVCLVIGAVLLGVLVTVQLLRPVPVPQVVLTVAAQHTFSGAAPALPWPARVGEAVVDVEGLGRLGSIGNPTPTPTASVAKVMTAYVFLKNHPLRAREAGPTFTIGAAEAARLSERKARDESHINVVAGQPFTERQALEALMIVSANNIAHELARWDAGSDAAYVAKMNATARALGMAHTTYTDPSGYLASTVSTAADQAILLSAAMAIPAFAEVVGKPYFDVPGDNTAPRQTTNSLLGQDGVIGGKTGYTSAAGGNYVFAARKNVHGVNVLIVGAVMAQAGVPSSEPTVAATKPLIEAAERALTYTTLAAGNAVVAQVDDGLGGRTPLIAGQAVTVVGWSGLTVRLSWAAATSVPPQAAAGSQLGAIAMGDGANAPRIPLVLGGDLNAPSPLHRLTRLG